MNSDPLSKDIVGSQKNPPVVDHTWLAVDLGTYDNIPTDNQPLRTLPKLSELWNPPQAKDQVMNLIPNRQCPCQAPAKNAAVAESVVREAKKGMMAGASGHKLADYLKARFTSAEIESAKDDLVKLSAEQGLLGNVYIDASAFDNYTDAERFLTKHRTRLARDIVAGGTMTPAVLGTLASDFRKNVVASVTYDESLFKTYKDHLVALHRISRDTVIDSKESLRRAFLADPKQAEPEPEEKPAAPAPAPAVVAQAIESCAEASELKNRLAAEEISFRELKPIVVFAREQMAKGKSGSDLRGILRDKYSAVDLKAAARYLAVVSSDKAVASIPRLVSENKLSESVGNSLAKLAKELPIRRDEFEAPEPHRSAGAQGYFMAVVGTTKTDSKVVHGAVQALRIGHDMTKVRKALMSRMTLKEADEVLSEAVRLFNAGETGVRANRPAKATKVVIDEPEAKSTGLTKEASDKQRNDIVSFFEGGTAEMIVDVDPVRKGASIDIQDQFNRAGMDSILGA